MGEPRAPPSPWKMERTCPRIAFPSHSSPGQPPGGEDLPGAAQELRRGWEVTNTLTLLPAAFPSSCENCQSPGRC